MHLVRAGDDSLSSAIDFGGIESAINVQNGARIEFRGLALRHPAPQRWTTINDTYLVNTAFAALPSINAAPNATVRRLLCVSIPLALLYTLVTQHVTWSTHTLRYVLFVQVVYNNVSTEFYSAYSGNSPEQFTARVYFAIKQLGSSVSSNAIRQGNYTIVWEDTNYLSLTASVNITGTLVW